MKLSLILLEYNQEKTIKNLGAKLIHRSKHDTMTHLFFVKNWKQYRLEETRLQHIFMNFESIDPTSNKMYVVWLLRQWIAEQFKFEDLNGKVKSTIELFHNIKMQLKKDEVSIDINQYTFETLEDTVDVYEIKQSGKEIKKEESAKARQESKILYEGPLGLLVIPETEAASCFWGRGTRWCTAATESDNMFADYTRDGPLYIWIGVDGGKYQFQFESNQFMDEQDRKINTDIIKNLRMDHPVISKLFKRHEQKLLRDAKAFIAIDGAYMFNGLVTYAKLVIRGRWPEAEPYIMKSNDAVRYAAFIIQGRWPEAEPYIMKSDSAVWYASDVIKGRWPEAEPYIMKSDSAVWYAENVIEGRWPEAEAYILDQQDSVLAKKYARDILNGPWPEADHFI